MILLPPRRSVAVWPRSRDVSKVLQSWCGLASPSRLMRCVIYFFLRFYIRKRVSHMRHKKYSSGIKKKSEAIWISGNLLDMTLQKRPLRIVPELAFLERACHNSDPSTQDGCPLNNFRKYHFFKKINLFLRGKSGGEAKFSSYFSPGSGQVLN